MDSQSITERAYAGIKSDLLSGVLRPGERLDAATLARRHGASITPIREALNRLAGERLIVAHARHGFAAPLFSEGELRALYEWTCQQLVAALRMAPPLRLAQSGADLWPTPELFERAPVAAVELLCLAVARLSGNVRCYHAIEQTNVELRTPRRLERQLFAPDAEDLRDLPRALSQDGVEAAEVLLAAYHGARSAAAGEIVGLLTMAAHHGLPSEGGAGGPPAPWRTRAARGAVLS